MNDARFARRQPLMNRGFTAVAVLSLAFVNEAVARKFFRGEHPAGQTLRRDGDDWRIVGPILRESLLLAVAGVAGGVPLLLGLARLIRSGLYGAAPTDPATLLDAVLLLLVVALLSAGIPAIRAAKLEPMEALRHE